MKRFWTSPRTRETARSRHRSRLQVEVLEERNLLANYLLIDFAPDAVPSERWQPASFANAFNLRYANGYAPAFLDFDQDGYVGSNDVGLGAQAIANRVAQYFQQFDIQVWYGDVDSDTNLGWQWLTWGLQSSSDQVFVMYTGGIRQDGDINILGEAYQPAVGYLNEYYAYTYATSVVRYFMEYWSGATPQQFTDKMAQVIVHEFGHLVGLGHVYGNPQGDPNVMNYNSNASSASIPDAWYQYIKLYDNNRNNYWGWQNPAQELRASLRGEPNFVDYFRGIYSRYEGLGHYLVTVEEIMGDGHREHTHEAGDAWMPDEHERHDPQELATASGDLDGLVTLLAETRLEGDRERREVLATVPTSVRGPLVPTPAPEPAPASAVGQIASELVRSVRRRRGDSLNREDTAPLDLASLPGISLEKDELLTVR
ncbi:MAG: hypothetical protein L0Z62_26580 [Gemmataceae bacterium]|nr:hypothetical protein [Gemmataceae bacterium]